MAIRLNPIFLIDGPLGKDRNADVHGYNSDPLAYPLSVPATAPGEKTVNRCASKDIQNIYCPTCFPPPPPRSAASSAWGSSTSVLCV